MPAPFSPFGHQFRGFSPFFRDFRPFSRGGASSGAMDRRNAKFLEMLAPKDHWDRFDPSRESLAEMAARHRHICERSMAFTTCGAQFSAQNGGDEGAARAFDQPSGAGGVQPGV
jgi:hypothetical protein